MPRTAKSIRVAVAGVGNCASALIQGLSYYARHPDRPGLINKDIGGYTAANVEVVLAFDVDPRKVGRPINEAIFCSPNCVKVFEPKLRASDVVVQMAPPLDGVAPHTQSFSAEESPRLASILPVDIAQALRNAKADVLVCLLPVGAEAAAHKFAEACLEAGTALVNGIPVFIASDPGWAKRFKSRKLPLIGDDVKSQVGATIAHRALAELLQSRGYDVSRTYQLNTGGNTDFLNMLDRSRLRSKKTSKTRAVQSALRSPLPDQMMHIGPSDYVPWLKDNKIAFIRLEGQGFGGAPIEIDIRLSVQDSPNSAAVLLDAIRFAKLCMDRRLYGAIDPVCAYYMKSPPRQLSEADALRLIRSFVEVPLSK